MCGKSLGNRHWSFGLAGAFASGTPFTAPSSVSVLNGNLIVDYGAHNANRLPAYFRLDLSANYQWSGKWIKRHALNFSLYNATNRSNHLFYSLKVRKNGDFYYGPTTFMLGLLPSLSYGIIVKWAAVSVTDGIDTVYLTGKYDAGYFPPYVYTTTRMRGVAGRTYELCVDWQDYHATAQTVIPSAPAVDSFSVKRAAGSDSLFVVEATITDPAAEKNYYQLYSRVGGSVKQYLAAYLGTLNDDVMKRPATVPVYRGHRAGTGQQYIPYFKLGDTVSVKVAHIGADAFRFWSDYNSVFSESGNVLFAPSHGVRGNMVGAQGYWQGQNARTAYFIIPHRL